MGQSFKKTCGRVSIILCIVVLHFLAWPLTVLGQEVPKLKKLSEKELNMELAPWQKKDLWGYANEKGKFVIKPVFTAARPFRHGCAMVKYKGKWGVLNRDATFLFTPQFDIIADFITYEECYYSVVMLDGLYGVISTSGEIVCDIEYDTIDVSYFKRYGLFVVQKGDKYGVCGVNDLRLKAIYDQIILVSDGAIYNPKFCLAVRQGAKWAILDSNRWTDSSLEVIYDHPMVFKKAGSEYLDNIMDNQEVEGVGIVASASSDSGYINFSVSGERYPIPSKQHPMYVNTSALMKGTDDQLYVLFNSKQYTFAEYNKEMEKDMYARDRVLPEWARFYSTKQCTSDEEPVYEFSYGGQQYQLRYASMMIDYIDFEEMGGLGITDKDGKWVLKPVLSNDQPRSLCGLTLFQSDMGGSAIVQKNGRFGRLGNWRYSNLPFIFTSYEEAAKYEGQRFDDCYAVISREEDKGGYHKYGYADDTGIFIPVQYYCYFYGGEGISGFDIFEFTSSGYTMVNTEPSDKGKRVIINRQNEIVGPPEGKSAYEYLEELNAKVPIPEAVDLGLSVKWASFNLGASAPEEYGNYYAWGETEPKDSYTWFTYKWYSKTDDVLTRYNTDDSYGPVDNKTEFKDYGYEDDAARANLGGIWRVPTQEEWDELIEKCTWKWTARGGVDGYTVTGPNGNSIFLPAAGLRSYDCLDYEGSSGDYWSSSLNSGGPRYAWYVCFHSDNVGSYSSLCYFGLSVRPVTE